MSVRKTIFSAFGVILVVTLGVLLFGVQRLLRSEFEQIEDRSAGRETLHAEVGLRDVLHQMRHFAKEWAMSEATYGLAADEDWAPLAESLSAKVLGAPKLDALLFFDVSGRLRASRWSHAPAGSAARVPTSVTESLYQELLRWKPTAAGDVRSGILTAGEQPLLVVASPIQSGRGRRPVRGTLVAARLLDGAALGSLGASIGGRVTVWPLRNPAVPAACRAALGAAPTGARWLTRTPDLLVAYVRTQDISGNPDLVLRIELPRELAGRSREILRQVALWLGALALLLGGALAVSLERIILRPLGSITQGVSRLWTGVAGSVCVERHGAEELANLARALNDMISRQLTTSEELRQSEMRFRGLFEKAQEAILLLSVDGEGAGRVVSANPAAAALYGYEEGTLRGMHLLELSAVLSAEDAVRDFERIRAGEWLRRESNHRSSSGRTFPVEVSAGLLELGGNRGVLAFVRDITARRESEEALRQSEARYRGLLAACPDPVIVYDADGTTSYVNAAFVTTYGWTSEEIVGRRLDHFVPPEERERSANTWKHILAGEKVTFETARFAKDGRRLRVQITAALLHTSDGRHAASIVIHRDVTEQREAEEQQRKAVDAQMRLERAMMQSQRLQSLGVLAGGIAHDFNNILTPIIGFTEQSIDDVPGGSQLQKNLEAVLAAAHRAKELVWQILAFSRESEDEAYPIRVTPIVEETLQLLRASLPSTIEIRADFRATADTIHANPSYLHQIVMNLGTNAGHAMESAGGVLEVIVEQGGSADRNRGCAGGPTGDVLRITISDTGCGISPSVVDSIFDPFFTTKDVGKGTGMGLALVHGLVTKIGGTVEVESELGRGSRFQVLLPLFRGNPGTERTGAPAAPLGGRERILLVDDEQLIVDVWRLALGRLGYDVVSTTSSSAALALFREEPQAFDVVVTDQTMPEMLGTDLAREILASRPDTPVILCTGFSTALTHEQVLAQGVREFLLKPVTCEGIAQAVRRALGPRRGEDGRLLA